MARFGLAEAVLLALLLFVQGCGKKGAFRVESIVREASVMRSTNSIEPRIASTVTYLSSFVNTYREAVRTNVHPSFYKEFSFLFNSNVNAEVLLSDTSETVLRLWPGSANSLSVYRTRLPAQLAFMTGVEYDNPFLVPARSHSELIEEYQKMIATFAFVSSGLPIKNFNVYSSDPKLVALSQDSVVVLQNVSFVATNLPVPRTNLSGPYCLISGTNDLGGMAWTASHFGLLLAQFDIIELFRRSEFFRASLAHPRLKAIATTILSREELKRTGKEDYPFWEFRHDWQRLVNEAKKFNFDEAYADSYFLYEKALDAGGHLLWSYQGSIGFFWQWFFVSVFFLPALFLLKIRKKRPRTYVLSSLVIALLAVHGWIFAKKPETLTIGWWILPGCLFLAVLIPVSWRLHKDRPSG